MARIKSIINLFLTKIVKKTFQIIEDYCDFITTQQFDKLLNFYLLIPIII